MAFEKIVPQWNAAGTEPPASLKNSGFTAGYQPPADFFNWFWHGVSEALAELQDDALHKNAGIIDANANLDNCIALGIYTFSASASSSIVNAPVKEQSSLIVLPRLQANDPANRVQLAVTQSNKLYVRNLFDGVWNNWVGIDMSSGGGRLVPNTCTQISDWNKATMTGWYMGNNAANAPTSGNDVWFFGTVIAHNSNYVLQEAYHFTVSANAVEIPKYIRASKDGVWGDWKEVTVKGVVPADLQKKLDDKMSVTPSRIEFVTAPNATNGGYIDFKFNGSTVDYTSRIIEDVSGRLNLIAANGVRVSATAPEILSARNVVMVNNDPGAGAAVSYPDGTVIHVYE